MTGIDEFLKLEETVLEASKTISLLGKDRDNWKTKYQGLVEQIKKPVGKGSGQGGDVQKLVKVLEEENKMLRTRIQEIIHQTEELRDEINSRLND